MNAARLLVMLITATTLGVAPSLVCADSSIPSSSSTSVAAIQTIKIGNFSFQPQTLTVSAGSELTWINEDDAPHTVVGTEKDSPIKSNPLDTDDRYSIKMTKPGTYSYFCSLHPHMTGTIVVR